MRLCCGLWRILEGECDNCLVCIIWVEFNYSPLQRDIIALQYLPVATNIMISSCQREMVTCLYQLFAMTIWMEFKLFNYGVFCLIRKILNKKDTQNKFLN